MHNAVEDAGYVSVETPQNYPLQLTSAIFKEAITLPHVALRATTSGLTFA
jgi:hypothetical protein